MKHGTAVKGVAHRGFSSQAPENSRVAFAMAAEGDFYGIECDIWRTRDGQYVVSHDNQMERMYGQPWKITEKTYEEIRKYPMIRGSQAVKHPPQHMVLFTGYLSILAREETTHPVIELKMDYTTAQLREIVDLVKEIMVCMIRTVFISLHPQVLVLAEGRVTYSARASAICIWCHGGYETASGQHGTGGLAWPVWIWSGCPVYADNKRNGVKAP